MGTLSAKDSRGMGNPGSRHNRVLHLVHGRASRDHSCGQHPACAASPAPASFQPKTLLDYSGTGPGNTPAFDAGVTGNFNVYWSYSGNNTVCPDGCDAAQSVEFSIQENAETAGPGVNGSGYPSDLMPASGSGIVTMQGDPGTHSFTVSAVPGCKWTIKVLVEP